MIRWTHNITPCAGLDCLAVFLASLVAGVVRISRLSAIAIIVLGVWLAMVSKYSVFDLAENEVNM